MKRSVALLVSVVAGGLVLLLACAGPVHAQEASSDGYAIKASLNLLGIDALSVAPQAQVSFDAQAVDFLDQQSVPGLDEISTLGLLGVNAGLLSAGTQYRAPLEPHGFAVVATQSHATDVIVSAVSLIGGGLLDLRAHDLHSQALVSGYCPEPLPALRAEDVVSLAGAADNLLFRNGFDPGNLEGDGNSGGYDDGGVPGVIVSVLDTPTLDIPIAPARNTSIDLLGLGVLVLNEYIETGDGIQSRGVVANALRLSLNTGLLSADVVIAHSAASLACP